jgi:prefoldin subunit 5
VSDLPTAREFGQIEERVRALDSKFGQLNQRLAEMNSQVNDRLTAMSEKLDEQTRLMERGKGAYLGALGLASTVGAVVAWGVKTFAGKVPGP